MRNRLILLLSVLIIASFLVVFYQPLRELMNDKKKPANPEITEQKAETVIRLKALPDPIKHGKAVSASEEKMRALQEALVERIDQYVTVNAELEILPDQQLELRVPAMDAKQVMQLTDLLSKCGVLAISEVHPLHNNNSREAFALAAKVASGEEIVPTYRSCVQYQKNELGELVRDENGKFVVDQYWLVSRKAALTNVDLEYVGASISQPGTVEVSLNDIGADRMRTFTRNMKRGDYIVTMIDETIVSAATLNSKELGRHFVITGMESKEAAEALATALMNPLPCDVKVISVTP